MEGTDAALDHIRGVCLALPEVDERLSHGAPTFFIRGKKTFLSVWSHGHHDNEFPHLWCAAADGVQARLIADRSSSSSDRRTLAIAAGWASGSTEVCPSTS